MNDLYLLYKAIKREYFEKKCGLSVGECTINRIENERIYAPYIVVNKWVNDKREIKYFDSIAKAIYCMLVEPAGRSIYNEKD